jgi:hypothetical protein
MKLSDFLDDPDPVDRAIRVLELCFSETGDPRFLKAKAELRPPGHSGRLRGSGIHDRPCLLRAAHFLRNKSARDFSSAARLVWQEISRDQRKRPHSEESFVRRLRRKWNKEEDSVLAEIEAELESRRMVEDMRAAHKERLSALLQPAAVDTPAEALGSLSLTIR